MAPVIWPKQTRHSAGLHRAEKCRPQCEKIKLLWLLQQEAQLWVAPFLCWPGCAPPCCEHSLSYLILAGFDNKIIAVKNYSRNSIFKSQLCTAPVAFSKKMPSKSKIQSSFWEKKIPSAKVKERKGGYQKRERWRHYYMSLNFSKFAKAFWSLQANNIANREAGLKSDNNYLCEVYWLLWSSWKSLGAFLPHPPSCIT